MDPFRVEFSWRIVGRIIVVGDGFIFILDTIGIDWCVPTLLRTSSSILGAILRVNVTIAAHRIIIKSPTKLTIRAIIRFLRSAAANIRCCLSSNKLDGARSTIEPIDDEKFVLNFLKLSGWLSDCLTTRYWRKGSLACASVLTFPTSFSDGLVLGNGWDCSSVGEVGIDDINR